MNFWSTQFIVSIPFKTFLIIYLLSFTMKVFNPTIPNESKNNNLLVREMFKMLHQCVSDWSSLSVIGVMKEYIFFRHHFFKYHKFIYFIGRKHTKKIIINVFIIYIFKYLLIFHETYFQYLINWFTNQINPSIYKIITYASI